MKRFILFLIMLFLVLFLLSNIVFSHEGDLSEESTKTLKNYTSPILFISSLFIIISTIIALMTQNHPHHKLGLFLGIAIPVVIASIFVVYSTVYTNAISETKGPVHWHADYEIYNCGESIHLISPKGMLNRVGTSVIHDHNDNRIHIEGVVVDKNDANLNSFIHMVGGNMSDTKLGIPTDKGYIEIKNGDLCNENLGKWQGFLIKVTNPDAPKGEWIYAQQKLENFPDYIPAPYSYVPPGDCLILEFGDEKEKTEHVCETYEIALRNGDIKNEI